jgi:hypothetical protein
LALFGLKVIQADIVCVSSADEPRGQSVSKPTEVVMDALDWLKPIAIGAVIGVVVRFTPALMAGFIGEKYNQKGKAGIVPLVAEHATTVACLGWTQVMLLVLILWRVW